MSALLRKIGVVTMAVLTSGEFGAVTGQAAAGTTALGAAAQRGTVEQFASALVKEKPVGIVLLPNDVRAPHTDLRQEPSDALAGVDGAVRLFEARMPTYAVRRSTADGVMVLPRSGSTCAAFVRSRQSVTASGPAFDVLYRVYRAWSEDRSPELPPGMIGASAVYRTELAIDLVDATLAEALNSIVEQVPGLGWAVREVPGKVTERGRTRDTGCNVALFDGDSWLETSWTFSVGDKP